MAVNRHTSLNMLERGMFIQKVPRYFDIFMWAQATVIRY